MNISREKQRKDSMIERQGCWTINFICAYPKSCLSDVLTIFLRDSDVWFLHEFLHMHLYTFLSHAYVQKLVDTEAKAKIQYKRENKNVNIK